ncbi:phage head closure protein [Halobacillus sp. KGW1]|uniref:phage head closure protein n=1 Tax=Halobacillus sp. KGW1 TaxID=1793726 RepID=UPI0007851131|nr:phage head closure protein [Halobacillus sp. KGW1]
MRHNEVIYLIGSTVEYDELGNPVETSIERKVYANQLGVGQEEFYNALAQGLKPSKQFEVYSFEYDEEDRIKFEGVIYQVTRTQQKGDKVRLTCEKDVG